MIEDIKLIFEGKFKLEEFMVEFGMVMVLKMFNISCMGIVVGC